MMKYKRYNNIAIAFCLAFTVSVFLWVRSDAPPYGEVSNELNNNYWGYIVHIANTWRSGEFSFWDRELAGGVSLFTSGQYPVLNPTNIFALVLNNDQFFLFKLIEPFFIGLFFMCLFLLRFVSAPVAIGGALAYMGMLIARQNQMAESSIFLYGCALFPAMALIAVKFRSKPIISSSLIGVLLALQFSGEGVIQVPQMVIWWAFFYLIFILKEFKGTAFFKKIILIFLCYFVLTFLAAGLWGVQFIPTYLFTVKESVRMAAGHYDTINSFPLYSFTDQHSLLSCFARAISGQDGVSGRGYFFLIVLGFTLPFLTARGAMKDLWNKSMALYFWVTTLAYLSFPTFAGFTAKTFPSLGQILFPMRSFTFLYGIHTLDFCFVLTFCLSISNFLRLDPQRQSRSRKLLLYSMMIMGYGWAFLPGVVKFLSSRSQVFAKNNLIQHFFYAPNQGSAIVVSILVSLLLLRIFIKKPLLSFLFSFALITVGFMNTVTCWNWNHKGTRTRLSIEPFQTPENYYYNRQKGKFYLPYERSPSMAYDYNLLHDVKGTCSFLPIFPRRFSQFDAHYHNGIASPSWALTTFFPVDFTTAPKDRDLSWPGFVKTITGKDLDVWSRTTAPARVLLANRLVIKDFDAIIEGFDKPFDHVIMVDKKDADLFNIHERTLAFFKGSSPYYHDFEQKKDDEMSFKISSQADVLVMVPEMFQNGWELWIDRKRSSILPAWYIFLGFEAPVGGHVIQLRFCPPGLRIGIILTFLSILYLVVLMAVIKKRVQ